MHLPDFTALADYVTANKTTLLAAIQAETDKNSAYLALYTDLAAWIDANVGDTSHQLQMKLALDALIKPRDSELDDLMDLLFIQDSDLLSYATGECPEFQPGVFDFALSQHDWECAGDSYEVCQYVPDARFEATVTGGPIDASLRIRRTSLSSVDAMEITGNAKYSFGYYIRVIIYTADDLAGPWTERARQESVTTAVVNFAGLGIVDKYIKVRMDQFETNSWVHCYKVEFLS